MPRFSGSEWRECHALNAAGGLEMLEWQDAVMEGWLGRDALGRWSAPTCGGSVPRQNGKSLGLVEARANYGMTVLREEVIYTSHLQKTSTETFEDMASFFDQPALRAYVKDVKTALGREQIVLKNGARIKFLARTRNGGRGQHGDLLVFDEALELDAESQASFLPAISASRNPQTLYVSTPPAPKSPGSVFREIRRRALDGESARTAWFEWGVDEIGDVTDRDRWYATNPSLGILIQESTVEGECEQMDADTFACERLGWWFPLSRADSAMDAGDWDACRIDDPRRDGIEVYAVKFSPDGSMGVLASCVRPDGGAPFVHVVEGRALSEGIGWFVDTLMRVSDRAAQIVVDGRSNAQTLCERLLAAGVGKRVLVTPSAADVASACAGLANAVKERSVTHFGQAELDASAKGCVKRRIGKDGGWGFDSTAEADATLVEACALAHWGAMTTRRRPDMRGRAGC